VSTFQLVVVALATAALSPVGAQETKPQAAPPAVKMVCLPFYFSEDRPSAVEKVKGAFKTLVQSVGMEWIDEGRVVGVWTRDMGERLGKKEIPENKKLLELGQRLGSDYVAAGTCSWQVRSVWVGLGPKTKAICTVELVIVDVKGRRVAHHAVATADSTKKEEEWATAAALLVNPLFTVVSGGPKTPHMERSGVVATAKALEEWLKPLQRRDDEKIR